MRDIDLPPGNWRVEKKQARGFPSRNNAELTAFCECSIADVSSRSYE